ncbi:MAG: Hpt domain-containing protein [Frankiaceae bacterium]|nr:Hpt domain-containing protein [Arenimonas sp.]
MSDPTAKDQQTRDQLKELEAERPGLMKELIRLFVADAPKQTRLIHAAYDRRDPELVRQSAHFLRSGSLALGLSSLAEYSRVIEHLALEAYGDKASDLLVAELRAEVHKVLLVLLKQLKDG